MDKSSRAIQRCIDEIKCFTCQIGHAKEQIKEFGRILRGIRSGKIKVLKATDHGMVYRYNKPKEVK